MSSPLADGLFPVEWWGSVDTTHAIPSVAGSQLAIRVRLLGTELVPPGEYEAIVLGHSSTPDGYLASGFETRRSFPTYDEAFAYARATARRVLDKGWLPEEQRHYRPRLHDVEVTVDPTREHGQRLADD